MLFRLLLRLILLSMTVIGGPSQARASILTLVNSSLSISVFPVGWDLPVTFSQNTAATPISVSSGNGFTEPASIFTGSVMLPTGLFTGIPLIHGFTVANLGHSSKYISPNNPPGARSDRVLRQGGGLGGPGALSGVAFVNVLALFNIAIPLSPVGSTGATVALVAGTLIATVAGTGWTTGKVTIDGISTGDPGTNTVYISGYDHRTMGGAGVVRLVTAAHVITGAAGNFPIFAVQTLTFTSSVPEAGVTMLLALGVAGLLFQYGRTRRSG
jgi:hypothetical protein